MSAHDTKQDEDAAQAAQVQGSDALDDEQVTAIAAWLLSLEIAT